MADGIDFGEDDGLDIPEGLAGRIPHYGKWAADGNRRADEEGYDGASDGGDGTSHWEAGWVQTFGGRGADVVQAKQAPETLFGTDDPQDGTEWLRQFDDGKSGGSEPPETDDGPDPEDMPSSHPTPADDAPDRIDRDEADGTLVLPKRGERPHTTAESTADAVGDGAEAPDDLFGADDPRNRTAWLSQFGGDGHPGGEAPEAASPYGMRDGAERYERPRPPRLSEPHVPRVPQMGEEPPQRRRGWQPADGGPGDMAAYEGHLADSPHAAAESAEASANGVAIFAMVAAVMALVLGVVPALGLYLFPIPALVGIVAGVAGVVTARRNGGTGWAVARSAIALALLAVLVAALTQAVLVALGIVGASVSSGVMTLTFSF